MLKLTLTCCIILLSTTPHVFLLHKDYYWREYTGTIPEDAVVGGKDINDQNTYIGQAYVKDRGLIVAQIHPGVKEVYAPIYGVKTVTTNIKILCGPSQMFYWMRANSTDLHLTLIDKHAVIGGYQDGRGQLNIGRVSHEGEIKIGKVDTWNLDNPCFFFNDKGNERRLKSFEILLYKGNILDATIPDPETGILID